MRPAGCLQMLPALHLYAIAQLCDYLSAIQTAALLRQVLCMWTDMR